MLMVERVWSGLELPGGEGDADGPVRGHDSVQGGLHVLVLIRQLESLHQLHTQGYFPS